MNIFSPLPQRIIFSSKNARLERKVKRNTFLANRLLQQLSQCKTGVSMVDFCTCNRWDWMVHGLSGIKTNQRHKRKTVHVLNLRLISPIEDNTCWVQLEVNKRGSRKVPPKRLLIINTWLEKTSDGFKLHRVNEEKRLALENEINKFGRETTISSTGEILIDPKAVQNKKQSKHWAPKVLLQNQPKLIKSIIELLKKMAAGVINTDDFIADNKDERKAELAIFLDIKA